LALNTRAFIHEGHEEAQRRGFSCFFVPFVDKFSREENEALATGEHGQRMIDKN